MSTASPAPTLHIGWSSVDITPDQPVLITGQFYARVSEGVMDPVSATVLAIESAPTDGQRDCVIFVTCDLVAIPDSLRDAIHAALRSELPEFDPLKIICHATHTHAGPEVRYTEDELQFLSGDSTEARHGVKLDVMEPKAYADGIAIKIARAIAQAWHNRAPGGISYGIAHAAIGVNRRVSYYDGKTIMYGKTNTPDFSHIEAPTDTSVNLLYTWNIDRQLTGVAINLACPSQHRENSFKISADYWCETRQALRAALGQKLHIISLNSASGDLVPPRPGIDINWPGHERMRTLRGQSLSEDLGARITDAVTSILPVMKEHIDWQLPLVHQTTTLELPKRKLSQQDVDDALKLAGEFDKLYNDLKAQMAADPAFKQQPRWYKQISMVYRKAAWNREVANRYERQKTQPMLPIEVHVIQLGDIAFATNPFEYYLDYAHQIKARSNAVQTFLVQHVGSGTYLPTERAVRGGSYGALPASTPVGPDGGRLLADFTINAINTLIPQRPPE